MSLIMKRKMICVISSRKTWQNTLLFDADCSVICAISSCKVMEIVLHLIINYVNISNKPSAVTNVVICNAVGVVPLIAQD